MDRPNTGLRSKGVDAPVGLHSYSYGAKLGLQTDGVDAPDGGSAILCWQSDKIGLPASNVIASSVEIRDIISDNSVSGNVARRRIASFNSRVGFTVRVWLRHPSASDVAAFMYLGTTLDTLWRKIVIAESR